MEVVGSSSRKISEEMDNLLCWMVSVIFLHVPKGWIRSMVFKSLAALRCVDYNSPTFPASTFGLKNIG